MSVQDRVARGGAATGRRVTTRRARAFCEVHPEVAAPVTNQHQRGRGGSTVTAPAASAGTCATAATSLRGRTWTCGEDLALGAGGAGAGEGATASSCASAGTCCSKPPSSTPHSASVRPGSRALPYNMRHVPPRLGSSALTLAVNTWRGSGTHLRADSDKSVFSRRWRPVTKITQTHTSTTSPGSTSTVTRASVSVRTDTRMLGKTRLLFVE